MMAAQCHRPNGQHKAHVSAVTVCRKLTIDKLENNTQSANESIFFLLPLTLPVLYFVVPVDRCCFSVPAVPGGDDLLWSADHLQHR